MSLATLKKKTQTKYNNMSVSGPFRNNNGFSLNGGQRNEGYIGKDSLGNSLPKTILKGNVGHGYGGCCGTFDNRPVVQHGIKTTNDASVIKKSVLNTKGMLANRKCKLKYKYCNETQPENPTIETISMVKPDDNRNNNTQQDRILRIKEEAIKHADDASCDALYEKVECDNTVYSNKTCNITKDLTKDKWQSYSTYLNKLTKDCVDRKLTTYTFKRTTMGASTTCG